MSSSTWTPHAVASNARVATTKLWRAVEAQHVASTLRLVDSIEEQHVIEDILDATKPAVPCDAQRLHYLLFTPFRYPAPIPSRFRDVNDPGVFYGARTVRTACAELGYWRWRFLTDSKGLAKLGPAPQTLFETAVNARAANLEKAPYSREANHWTHPSDYTACHTFARSAREAGLGLILYASVRDPNGGGCGAVLRPDAFSNAEPVSPTQTWILTVTRDYAVWQRERDEFAFDMGRWKPGTKSDD